MNADVATPKKPLSQDEATSGARRAALYAAWGAGVLALCKLILFFMTGSMVVALSAWDSTLDVCVSALNQKVIHFARQSPDSNHPYGHGKAESMAALAQGALIVGGAVLIMISSGQKLWQDLHQEPSLMEYPWPTAAFFIVAALASWIITTGLKHSSRKYNSPALAADSEHYRTDVMANLASALSLAAIASSGQTWLDPLLGGVFAINIGLGGVKLLSSSINDLLDHDIPESMKEDVLKLISDSNKTVIDVHNFRGRRSGHRYFIDFHITLPADLDFRTVHNITEEIEKKIVERFDADVVVHADPAEENLDRIRTAPGLHRKLHAEQSNEGKT